MSNTRRTRGLSAARAAATLAASLALGACALSANLDDPEAPVEEVRVVRYAVERGDRLSRIAREFTGDIELWRTIADLNGITDPRTLAVGQLLEIPVALIPEAEREARLADSVPLDPDDGAADVADAGTRLAELRARSAVSTRPPAASAGAERSRVDAEPVVVSAVRTREAFDLSPLEEASAATGTRFVKVVGSYTPKGIYVQPAVQSRVLMRVTPGTVLPLERDVDGWYRVTTSAGPGYLRDDDAERVDPEGGAGSGGAPSR